MTTVAGMFRESLFLGFEKMKEPTQEEAEAASLVVWDMIKFPVPKGFDPRLVRPCTKRFLESHGYSGPLTITAYGELTDVPNDILRGLYSSGIGLTHVAPDRMKMLNYIDFAIDDIPPPANILVLSEPYRGLSLFFGRMDYNVLQPFKCEADFRSFLAAAATDSEAQTTRVPAYWDCFVCSRDPPSQGFESFTSHLSSEEHQELALKLKAIPKPHSLRTSLVPSPEPYPPEVLTLENFCKKYFTPIPIGPPEINKEAVTSVFWDINKSPLPHLFVPSQVGPKLRRFMKNRGYSGRLAITAFGELTKVDVDILRGLYSGGIGLASVLDGSSICRGLIDRFTLSNPPPANIMVISEEQTMLQPMGYNCLPTLPFVGILWPDLREEDKQSETGELVCLDCDHASQGFENFITHLSSRPHERRLLDYVPMCVRISQKQPLK